MTFCSMSVDVYKGIYTSLHAFSIYHIDFGTRIRRANTLTHIRLRGETEGNEALARNS